MVETNKYWTGVQQARIPDLSWVSAKWGKGSWSENRLRLLNGAFEIYFLFKTAIDACPDAQAKAAMTEELEDGGTSGMGFGVSDLDEAFQHWFKAGPWTDNNTKTYMRANGIFGAQNPSIKGAQYCWGLPTNTMDGAEGAVNFLNALDKKLDELSGAIRGHNSEVANLANAMASKDGAKTKSALSSISGWAKKARKLLFLAPKPNESFFTQVYSGGGKGAEYGSFTPYIDLNPPGVTGQKPPSRYSTGTGSLVNAVSNVTQCINDLDTFLNVHDAALRTGIFDNRTATAFAALTVALGKVPILGSFYAEMVQNLPGFFTSMKDMFEEHYRRIDRETRVH